MATAANKNKIRTFEAEIGPQNKNIEAGQNSTGSFKIKKVYSYNRFGPFSPKLAFFIFCSAPRSCKDLFLS